MTKTPGIGPLEMKVLGLFDEDETLPISALQMRLAKKGDDLAYTTVLTVVGRLFGKGLLSRKKHERAYLYYRNKKSHVESNSLMARIQKTLFANERLKPILTLLDGSDDFSAEELNELREKVDAKLKAKKKNG